jgi:hypothetical protein
LKNNLKNKKMDKTIEILEKSIVYAKKQLINNWEKLEENQIIEVKRGLQNTLNFIEELKVINENLKKNGI